ncbi:MAG: flagellar basal body rod protein FlgB [Armatimonadota bacterium]
MEVTVVADAVVDLTTRALSKALDCTAEQHRVAANNLANIETPGYTARRGGFEDALRAAVRAEERGERPGAIETVRPSLEHTGDPAGPDGNNVSIETEMMELGEASLRFKVLTRMLHTKLQMIGNAINDGRS